MRAASKIAIVGTGAIGGLLGFRFAQAGFEVTFFDRGRRCEVLEAKGLSLIGLNGEKHTLGPVRVLSGFEEAGKYDLVILSVKAHQIKDVAPFLIHLFHSETYVVTVQNGLPWWYFQKTEGDHQDRILRSMDPEGKISQHIAPDRLIGCVAYPAATVLEHGVIKHVEGDRFPVGELDGRSTPRVEQLRNTFEKAGFRSRVLEDIRSEIWLKAWGSLSLNPISALTHATLQGICQCPETRSLAGQMMAEAQEIAEKLGVKFRHTIEKRLQGAEGVGAHKTSMLQDVEAGLELELDALVGSVIELAKLTETPVPTITAVYACAKLLNRSILESQSRLELLPRGGP